MRKTILTRIACLGQFTLRNCFINARMVNHQKNRVDYAVKINQDPSCKILLDEVENFIPAEIQSRKMYIYSLLQQERLDIFSHQNVQMLIMDSFAELTDKLFVSRSNKSEFLAHWKDIDHSKEFEERYDFVGLLPLEEIQKSYKIFFQKFCDTYGQIPILFLHFPTDLDSRTEYKIRSEKIKEAILSCSKKWPNIIPITTRFPAEANPNDEAVYHFSERFYEKLAQQICEYNLPSVYYLSPRLKNVLNAMYKIIFLLIKLIPITSVRRRWRSKIRERNHY